MQIRELLRSRQHKALSIAVLAALAVWVWAIWPKAPVMTVTFLSVGQGDCEVIQTPSGHTILVDAGPCKTPRGGFDAGLKAVVPFLRRQGINYIDAFVISHPHEDHIGGAPAVIENFPVGTVLDSGLHCPAGEYTHLLASVRSHHIRYRRVRTGNVIDLHDGVRLEVVSPSDATPESESDSAVNDSSVVVRVGYGKVHVLLSGDSERPAEDEMLSNGSDLTANVLKVPHHGSASATAIEWLQAVHPQVAVISVGWHNQFGLPSEETLARLKDAGCDVYRTDQNGNVTVTTDGQSISVATGREGR
jgi:competence protein ComEC